MKSKSSFFILSSLYFFLFFRIKQAITKKDEQVQALRIQYETSIKRAEHLESLLTQQRKLISTKPSTKKTQPS